MKLGHFMQSLTGRTSIRCLEVIEAIFDVAERLSRKANGLRRVAVPHTVADQMRDSRKVMKAVAN